MSGYGTIPSPSEDGRRRSSISAPSRDELRKALSRVSLTDITPLQVNITQPSAAYDIMAKIMSVMAIVSFVPLFLPMFFPDDMDLGVKVAFGLSLLNMGLEYYWYTLGGSKIAFRVLSSTFSVTYGTIFVLTRDGVLDPALQDAMLGRWFGAVFNGLTFVCLAVASILGHSFVTDAMSDMMDEDVLTYPIIAHSARRMTQLWMTIFFLLFFIGVIGDPDLLSTLCLGLGFAGNFLYPKHLSNTIDQKMDLYKDEIEQWNKDHPDTELPMGM